MNSPDEHWWSVRAGESVLGTLPDSDLVLFERILVHDTDVQVEVARWEQRLAGLNETTIAHEPGEYVWRGILERVRRLDDETIGSDLKPMTDGDALKPRLLAMNPYGQVWSDRLLLPASYSYGRALRDWQQLPVLCSESYCYNSRRQYP